MKNARGAESDAPRGRAYGRPTTTQHGPVPLEQYAIRLERGDTVAVIVSAWRRVMTPTSRRASWEHDNDGRALRLPEGPPPGSLTRACFTLPGSSLGQGSRTPGQLEELTPDE
jgi:hypothetical protein